MYYTQFEQDELAAITRKWSSLGLRSALYTMNQWQTLETHLRISIFTSHKAADICKWMNVKAFGTANPDPYSKLTGAGSSSLEFSEFLHAFEY